MLTVSDVCRIMEEFAPPALAAEWDNVGLLVGDRRREVGRVMTCLTLTPASKEEAVASGADMVITHHPLPFRPLNRITSDTAEGRLLLDLIGAGIAVYSPHTAFDSTDRGINRYLAEGLGLDAVRPLLPATEDDALATTLGAGRLGRFASPLSLRDLVDRVKDFLSIPAVRIVGSDEATIGIVAVACGSGGSFLSAAREHGCHALVTGETGFHTCLEAQTSEISLVLTGHFASERFALVKLADYLADQLKEVKVWASQRESDPLRTV